MVFITKYSFFSPLFPHRHVNRGAQLPSVALGLVCMQRRKVMMSCWRRCQCQTWLSLFVLDEHVIQPRFIILTATSC